MVARREWRWVLVYGLIALSLANAPILLGAALSTPENQFGGSVYNVEDTNSYLAKMKLGADGRWLFRLVHTPEDSQETLLFTFYLLLGKFARLTGLPPVWAFHLARLASGAVLFVTVYLFCAHWTAALAVRRAAFLLATFGSGLGWLFILLGRPDWGGLLTLDLIQPEAYVFLSTYAAPHIPLAVACVLGGVLCALRAARGRARCDRCRADAPPVPPRASGRRHFPCSRRSRRWNPGR